MAVKNIKLPNITARHPEYVKYNPKWLTLRDVLAGQDAIKAKGAKYLPQPNSEGSEEENTARYESYLLRAVFYGVVQRTVEGLVGQVFSKPPTSDFPEEVKYLNDDPAGTGITLEQQAKDCLGDLLSLGRGGLLVDYPKRDTPASKLEMESGEVRPIITFYKPEDIINWRVRKVGVITKTSLVVLSETYIVDDDGFDARTAIQYRVLSLGLDDGIYRMRIYRPQGKAGAFAMFSESTPVDSTGRFFDHIPFVFLGIENNDPTVDAPPMYSMAVLNIAHYRNSADYEEACFMVGQPTLWYSGITQEFNDTILKGRVYVGSRGGLPLPPGGAAGLLQVAPNSLCKEAMDQKEDQMVALGARLVQSSGVRRTATEVTGDKVSEMSVLASAARNTSAAYAKAFEYCAMFSGATAKIQFELSTDFDMARMTSQEILALFTVWTGRLISTSEARDILRRAGIATLKFDEAVAEGVAKEAPEPAPAAGVHNSVDNNAKPKQ